MSEIRDASAEPVAVMDSSVQLIDPANDRVLLNYFDDVYRWHGFIRFVGVPTLRDERPTRIDSIFIEPRLARDYVRGGSGLTSVLSESLASVLAECPKLVILGDPGTGKSTLVSWLAWQSSSPFHRKAAGWTWQVPIPVVLREIDLSTVHDRYTLFRAMLQHPSMRQLKDYPHFPTLLANGQAFFLLDGLDEVPQDLRSQLGAAIRSAIHEFGSCRWIITSRVVGYEAFDLEGPSSARTAGTHEERDIMEGREERRLVERRYIAPLDDEQIDGFARRWFELREESTDRAASQASEFSEAVRRDEQTRSLARVASFLTLMALIYRSQARLPHGRALLYDKIVDAYLENIEASKHLSWTSLSLTDKKRCLADVAFEMQRSHAETGEGVRREILVSGTRLRELFARSISQTRADEFLDYLRDRSGLIQQLGPDQFAFAHLSFQDYFAALHLADRITSPRWIRGVEAKDGTSKDDLRRYFQESDWRETILLLFEVLAGRSDWCDALLSELFGQDIGLEEIETAGVIAALSVNPHSGLSPREREIAIGHIWELEVNEQQVTKKFFHSQDRVILRSLGSAVGEIQAMTWRLLGDVLNSIRPRRLSLAGYAQLPSLASIELPSTICDLKLDKTPFCDLNEISSFEQLFSLSLSDTTTVDLSPIVALPRLGVLDVARTGIKTIRPLLSLPALTFLIVDGTSINADELENLISLDFLAATGLSPKNLSFLSGLRNLETLYVDGSEVRDLSPLSNLTKLEYLWCSNTSVEDLGPLRSLIRLETLYCSNTMVSNLDVVRNLPALQLISFFGTHVTDISPLFSLPNLKKVGLPAEVAKKDIARLRENFPGIEIY